MILTLYTDASYCPRTGAAGWAAWIRFGPAPSHVVRRGGALRNDPGGSTAAELAAICNGLAVLRAMLRDDFQRLVNADFLRASPHGAAGPHLVVVRTDCLDAVRRITGKFSSPREYDAAVLAKIFEVERECGLVLRAEHVKSHRGFADRRSSVNTWCDEEAGLHMRAARHAKNRRLQGAPCGV